MKRHYVRVINNEFRRLQLDPQLRRKSLFDLIDYCVSLNEAVELGGPAQDVSYIRGFLVFNYFINSFIRVHFSGFDQFIESNKADFIIYLNIFDYYDHPRQLSSEIGDVGSETLKRYMVEYLVEKNVLGFDVHELYDWIHEYIAYLKETDAESGEDASDAKRVSHHGSRPAEDLSDATDRYGPKNINRGRPDPNDRSDAFSFEGSDDSVASFEQRFPAVPEVTTFAGDYEVTSPLRPKRAAVEMPSLPPMNPKISVVAPYPDHEHLDDDYIQPPQRDPTRPRGYHPARALSNGLKHSSPSRNLAANGNKTGHDSHSYSVDSTPPHQSPQNRQYQPYSSPSKQPWDRPPPDRPQPDRPQPDRPQPDRPQPDRPQPRQTYSAPPQVQSTPQPYYPSPPKAYNRAPVPPPHGQPAFGGPYAAGPVSGPPAPPAPASYGPSSTNRMPTYQGQPVPPPSVAYRICGLRNLGVSCYINSTIQLLFGIGDFKRIFAQDHHNYIRRPQFQQELANRNVKRDVLLLSDATASLLQTFSNYAGQVISPTKFVRIVSQIKPDFNIPNEQQDAQEFLLFCLDRLHEELSDTTRLSDASYERVLSEYVRRWDIHVAANDTKDYLKWLRSSLEHEGSSPIHDITQGHVQHKLVCGQCGYESTSYSPFTILSLALPTKPQVNLGECLRMFTSDEILSGDNAWNCPKCTKQPHALDTHPVFAPKSSGIFKLGKRAKSPSKETKKSAKAAKAATSTKKITVVKYPKVLFMHFSRFSMFSMTDKLDTMIEIPTLLSVSPTITYKLSGIINHYGNLKSGHYTATVNKSTYHQETATNRDNIDHPFWCNFDDSVVHENVPLGQQTPNRTHPSRDAYVLCYERV
ncbi:hypothetical protein DICA0_D18470 [Diutina catenulata]